MHSHTAKVVEWGLDNKTDFIPKVYGCTDCDELFGSTPPSNGSLTKDHTHDKYVEGCFACKLTTLQLNTGDANGGRDMSQKKWDKELDLYRTARKQGIQPEGTTTAKIQKALDVSDKTGHAYGSDL
jgi:hypothetical protein